MRCKRLLPPKAETIGLSPPKNGPSSGLDCEDHCPVLFFLNIRFKDEIELSFVLKVKRFVQIVQQRTNFEQNEDNNCFEFRSSIVRHPFRAHAMGAIFR